MNYDLNLPASSPKAQVSYTKMAKSVILGVIIALFSTVILFLVSAVIINAAFGDPDSVLPVFTCAGASAGALIGGFRASRSNGTNGLFMGLVTGIGISIIIFIIMLFAQEPASASVETDVTFRLIMILCNIFFACVGGIFAVNSKSRKASGYSMRKK